jgi:hypothetical protein
MRALLPLFAVQLLLTGAALIRHPVLTSSPRLSPVNQIRLTTQTVQTAPTAPTAPTTPTAPTAPTAPAPAAGGADPVGRPPPVASGVLLPTRELVGLAEVIARPGTGTNWPRWRFLSFAAMPPEQAPAAAAAVRYALATLNPGEVTPDQYLHRMAGGLWAIDTVALGWPAAFWESFARDEHYYSAAGGEAGGALAEFFRQRTGTASPLLRADQFLAGCWEPDRYVLAVRVPSTRAEFQRQFLAPDAARTASFGVLSERLSVSRHPGKVARFAGLLTRGGRLTSEGVVWMRALYANPPTAGEARLTATDLSDGDHYEFLWRLPNGLDGFASYDRAGRLALTVPTAISRDREHEGVRLGASCLACHASGTRSLDHADPAEKLVLFAAADPGQWDRDRLTFLAQQDGKRFAAALAALDVPSGGEAIRSAQQAAVGLAGDLDAEAASRELGLPTAGPVSRAAFHEALPVAAANRINRMFLDAGRQRLARAR